jgi:hypothetical protein
MIQTLSAQQSSEKWSRKAAASSQDYSNGIDNPRVDWATATKAAEPNFKTAVVEAANAGRFGKGVTAAGTAAWSAGAKNKGVPRWASGIAASTDKFAAGIQGVLSTISALTLPPRGVKGDPRNLERVRVIANALHAKAVK